MLRSEEAHGSGELNAKVAAIAHNRVSVAIMISRSVTGDRDSFTPECICILLGGNATGDVNIHESVLLQVNRKLFSGWNGIRCYYIQIRS
jgi:hypothetical protein